MRGFRNFLLRGDVIVIAVGLVVALAFSMLIAAFSTYIINPIINFVIFMAVVYFVIVVPYKHIQARRGQTVFGDPPDVKTCPACLSGDLPAAASKCKYCGTDQPPVAA